MTARHSTDKLIVHIAKNRNILTIGLSSWFRWNWNFRLAAGGVPAYGASAGSRVKQGSRSAGEIGYYPTGQQRIRLKKQAVSKRPPCIWIVQMDICDQVVQVLPRRPGVGPEMNTHQNSGSNYLRPEVGCQGSVVSCETAI